MKLLSAIVLIFVAIAANGKNFEDDGPEAYDLTKIHQNLNKMENGHSGSDLRGKGSKCKPNIACTILDGYCVVNTTLCSGRLVEAGCKGKNCQCCIPGDMSIHNLTREIQSIMDHQESAMINLTQANANLELQLNNMRNNQGCPEGGFLLPSTNQCFQLFRDSTYTFTEANATCQNAGLMMAKPYDLITLRNHLVMRYGNTEVWLGARGDGSNFIWEQDGVILDTRNPAWWEGYPGDRKTTCVVIGVNAYYWKEHSETPIWDRTCTDRKPVLCELVL